MADLDTAERRKLADQGKALPDGSLSSGTERT